MHKFPRYFFVSGTDTGVGKTFVSAICVAGLSAMYWKPVQTGSLHDSDRRRVQSLSRLPDKFFIEERFILKEPLSPYRAAKKEGISISLKDFSLPDTGGRPLVVEGAGGLLCPLYEDVFMIDLIEHLGLPVLLACRTELGTLNHTLLSVQALRQRKIDILGLVAAGEKHGDNLEDLQFLTKLPLLAYLPIFDKPEELDFADLFKTYFKIS